MSPFGNAGYPSSGCNPRPTKMQPHQSVVEQAIASVTARAKRCKAKLPSQGWVAPKFDLSRVSKVPLYTKTIPVRSVIGRGATGPGGVENSGAAQEDGTVTREVPASPRERFGRPRRRPSSIPPLRPAPCLAGTRCRNHGHTLKVDADKGEPESSSMGAGKSESGIVAQSPPHRCAKGKTPGNGRGDARGPGISEGRSCGNDLQRGTMPQSSNWENMSPELMKVASRARQEPSAQFHSLAHLLDYAALERAFHRLRADAAVGVDGVTKELYGSRLDDHLRDLHERLRTKRYRHQPIRRVNIPKESGGIRPLGVSCVEDKIVQDAIRELLSAVYEQDFLECSHGFRPGRSAHDAVRELVRVNWRDGANWVLEADIRSFFDAVPHQHLLELLRLRIPDGALLRLIGKCLRVGVLEGEELSSPDEGTPQGSILSPLLANIYLHHALDVWFEHDVKPRLRGRADLVRYADDFVMCFEREDDARRVAAVLPKRMEKFGLSLHPDKTRLFAFTRPPKNQRGGKGPGTFDFLGFTMYWRRARSGIWMFSCKTRSGRIRRAIQRIGEYCRSNRHEPLKEQYAGLCRRLRGHFNYFGVNGNISSLSEVIFQARGLWHHWLRRRSQRSRLTWERFGLLLERYPLPTPRIYVSIWQ